MTYNKIELSKDEIDFATTYLTTRFRDEYDRQHAVAHLVQELNDRRSDRAREIHGYLSRLNQRQKAGAFQSGKAVSAADREHDARVQAMRFANESCAGSAEDVVATADEFYRFLRGSA